MINKLTSNLYSESSQILIDFLYQFNKGTKNQFFTSNNFALYKSDFIDNNGFDINFETSAGEDREFCVRLNHKDIKLIYNPLLSIKHTHYLTISTFFKLHFKYGKAALTYKQKTSDYNLTMSKYYFYKGLFSYPFKQKRLTKIIQLRVCYLLFLSQVAVLVGFIRK